MPSRWRFPCSISNPIRRWKATEPLFTGAVTARTRMQPRAAAAPKKVSYNQPAASLAGLDSCEMDIGLAGLRLGAEPGEEPSQGPISFRGEARDGKVLEEKPGQHASHRPPAPPLIDHPDNGAIVGRAEVTDFHGAGHRLSLLPRYSGLGVRCPAGTRLPIRAGSPRLEVIPRPVVIREAGGPHRRGRWWRLRPVAGLPAGRSGTTTDP